MFQLEDVYENNGHAYFTDGKCIFDTNVLKAFSLTTTLLNIMCGYENANDINKYCSCVHRSIIFVPKGGNKVKFKILM